MNVDELLGRLERVKGSAGRWTARCPAHEDKSPSLSIREDADRILLKCHAGCTTLEVVQALDLELADLFLKPLTSSDRRWNQEDAERAMSARGLKRATLEYFRVTADLGAQAWVFPLGRGQGKKWKRFHAKAAESKYWTMGGNKLGCYHLAPCRSQQEAWLLEGEPDVWIAHQAGLPAFTLTNGASAINAECARRIHGTRIGVVHVVYDRDGPGEEGAQKVAAALEEVGQRFTVRELPAHVGVGGDVTTLYNNLGCDNEAFRTAMLALPERSVYRDTTEGRNERFRQEAIESLKRPQVIASWGWADFDRLFGPLVRGWLYIIGARPGNGKTSLLLSLLSRLREDGVATLYFGTEMAPADLVKKWAALRLGLDELRVFSDRLSEAESERLEAEICYVMATDKLTFSTSSRLDQDRIAKEVAWAFDGCRGPEPEIIILDHIHQVTQEREMLEILIRELKYLATERRVAMIVASQLSRPKDAGPFDLYLPPSLSRYKGAAAMEENLDVGLGLFRPLQPGLKRTDRVAVERGERSVVEFAQPNTMGVLCTKHRYGGKAAGKFVSLLLNGSRLESKVFGSYEDSSSGASHVRGDAWEAEDERLPF